MAIASPTSASGARPLQVRAAQFRVFFQYVPLGIVMNVIGGVLMWFGLSGVVPRSTLLAWIFALAVVLALCAVIFASYRRSGRDSPRNVWSVAAIACAGLTGAVWGAGGVFLFPPQPIEYQLLIVFVIGGLAFGAVGSGGAYLPTFYANTPVSLLPLVVMLIVQGDTIHVVFGIMVLIYLTGMAFVVHGINQALSESFRLQFENIDLARQLGLKRDEAERANVAKSTFLAAASHDLRQPLHALTLFVSALSERINYPDVRRMVDNIAVSVRALEKLFNALLDVSRLDAGVLQPEIADFPLQELFDRLKNDYASEAEAKGVRLVCDSGDVVVRSDPALLERILRNYLSNAIRYTDRGEVCLLQAALGEGVRIDVVDTGIGIAPAHHREIFNEFHQLGNPERDRSKGLGLGLAIVDRVARLLDLSIGVDSAPGKGSCFSVVVPLGDRARVMSEAAPADFVADELAGLAALIVDDDAGVREGMATLLEQWKCRVLLAGTEEEAVDVVRRQASVPEAIIVDYRLRDERTGVEAIERLRREFGADIPALVITGDTAPQRLRDVKAAGHQLLHKPVRPAMLRTFLRNARKRRLPG